MAVQRSSSELDPGFDQDPLAAYAPEDKYRDDPGYGWVAFAGVLLLVHGLLSVIYGLAALGNSRFVMSHPRYILGTLHTWGWIGVILGVTELIVGCGVLVKNQLSRAVGAVVLAVAAIAELLMVQTYPFWSLSLFALAIVAMYGLIAYGSKVPSATRRATRTPSAGAPASRTTVAAGGILRSPTARSAKSSL